MSKQIPALVVSGFLGSGKTTLVRKLLEAAQAEGKRVAFVSNELGELGVDQALLGGGTEAFVELAGGCVCCQLNDELYETLLALKEQVDPDQIVIETSGVALPHDVQIVLYGPPIDQWVNEEAVITVVNGEQLVEGRDLDDTFCEQIESADLVLLHKVDLVDPDLFPRLEAQINELNPGVPILRGSHGDVDPRLLFAQSVTARDLVDHNHDHEHGAYQTQVITLSAETVEEVETRIQTHEALRAKGFVRIAGEIHTVQGVGRRLEVTPTVWEVPEDLVGRVVVIGRV